MDQALRFEWQEEMSPLSSLQRCIFLVLTLKKPGSTAEHPLKTGHSQRLTPRNQMAPTPRRLWVRAFLSLLASHRPSLTPGYAGVWLSTEIQLLSSFQMAPMLCKLIWIKWIYLGVLDSLSCHQVSARNFVMGEGGCYSSLCLVDCPRTIYWKDYL